MIRYYDQKTGKRVSKATWKRSKAHGGTRYVRRSSKSGEKRNATGGRKKRPVVTPSQAPRNFKEYMEMYDQHEETDQEIEIETSVDY